MTFISAKLEGLDELRLSLEHLAVNLDAELGEAVEATGIELRGDIIKRYNRGPASGRWYQRYNPKRRHRASAPGEAPQTDTGRLAGAVVYKQVGPRTVDVAIAAKGDVRRYANALEYGTRRMAPRPAWRPATAKMQKIFDRRIAAVLARFAR